MPENDLQYYIASPFFAGIGQENSASRDSFLSRFDTLSQTQKDLLVSTATAEQISRIAVEAGLDDEQTEFLAMVVREVLTGLAQPSDTASLLMQHLQLGQDMAAMIASRVWSEVLNASHVQGSVQQAPLAPASPRPRQLNQQPASQEGEADHIINLRDEQL